MTRFGLIVALAGLSLPATLPAVAQVATGEHTSIQPADGQPQIRRQNQARSLPWAAPSLVGAADAAVPRPAPPPPRPLASGAKPPAAEPAQVRMPAEPAQVRMPAEPAQAAMPATTPPAPGAAKSPGPPIAAKSPGPPIAAKPPAGAANASAPHTAAADTAAKRPVRSRLALRKDASRVPAKKLFGAAKSAAALAPRAIGFYSRGCLAGGRQIAVDGPSWQSMRLSRNRRWGHPVLVSVVERLAKEASEKDGWPGLLVGDLAQPRGGPMLTGHASHQIGLDADIWLTPMPSRRLSAKEREQLSATSMLADKTSVDPKVWTDKHVALIKRAASYPEVERILVHPAIKKAICTATSADKDRAWLSRVRPYWGHHYHFHVRIGCPKGSTDCKPQAPTGNQDGCGKEIDDWMALLTAPPKPAPKVPSKPRPELTIDNLPKECRVVLEADDAPAAPVLPAQAVKSK